MDEDVNRSANVGIILWCYVGSGDGIKVNPSQTFLCHSRFHRHVSLFQADLIQTIHLSQLWKLFIFFTRPFGLPQTL